MKKFLQKIQVSTSGLLFQAFQPLAPMKTGTAKLSDLYSGTDLVGFIQKVFIFALTIGAIIALVRFMWAGYLYMGSEMWSSKTKAREIFTNIVFGLLLLMAIWLILNQINPQLLNLNILKTIESNKSTGLTAPPGSLIGPSNCGGACPASAPYCDPTTGMCI